MELAGSLAVVTGATEGIGRAIAMTLGTAGARVAICARTETNVRRTVGDFCAAGVDAVMATNVRSLYLMTRAFLGDMKASGGATIVNVASLAGKNGVEGGTAYCASKHAVLGFSRALMLEVRKHNIRVVAICPGSVDTGFRESRANRTRVLTADDVAHAILASLTVSDRAMISEVDIRPTNP